MVQEMYNRKVHNCWNNIIRHKATSKVHFLHLSNMALVAAYAMSARNDFHSFVIKTILLFIIFITSHGQNEGQGFPPKIVASYHFRVFEIIVTTPLYSYLGPNSS